MVVLGLWGDLVVRLQPRRIVVAVPHGRCGGFHGLLQFAYESPYGSCAHRCEYCWFVDLDTLWWTDLSKLDIPENAFGHVVATLPCKANDRYTYKTKVAELIHWMTEFHHEPLDFKFATTPIRFHRDSRLLSYLIVEVERLLERGDGPYNAVMKLLAHGVAQFGYHNAYVETTRFAACNPWAGVLPLRLAAKEGMFELETVQKESWGLNTYWQSNKGAMSSMFERGSYSRIKTGSFWDKVLNWAGPCWRDSFRLAASGERETKRTRLTEKLPSWRIVPALAWPMAMAPAAMPRSQSDGYPQWEQSSVYKQVELIQCIGSGTFGAAYLARRLGDSDRVAVKIQYSDFVNGSLQSCAWGALGD